MPNFFYRLNPPRPTFPFDISDEERAAMGAHAQYWTDQSRNGAVIGIGPVKTETGAYGIGILVADDLEAAERLVANDPILLANYGFSSEVSPMLGLITPPPSES